MANNKRWLPREGFTLDVVTRIIRNTILNPTLTLPLLLSVCFTDKGREIASTRERWLKGLKVFVCLGLARIINSYLSHRAANNGTSDEYDWNKEIVVITGGSAGIGKDVVLMLATRGIKVVVLDIQPLTFAPPPTVSFYQCDLNSWDEIEKVASEVRSAVGNPTVLVNNAGLCKGGAILDAKDANIKTTFSINTLAHYKLCKEFLPHMVTSNHGMVVTIASISSYVTPPQMVDYAASKAAALAFHEGLTTELQIVYKAPKVRTVLVTPDWVQTALFTGFGSPHKASFARPNLNPESVAEGIVSQILSGKSGHVALPVTAVYLVSLFRSMPDWFQILQRTTSLDRVERPANHVVFDPRKKDSAY